jgi:hypothetical protein
MVTPKSLGFTYEAIGQGWWAHSIDGMSTQLTNHDEEHQTGLHPKEVPKSSGTCSPQEMLRKYYELDDMIRTV